MAGNLILTPQAPLPGEPSPLPPGFGAEAETEGMDWERYITALKRFKWFIMLVVLLGCAAGMFLARRVSAEFTSSATLWVENGSSSRRNEMAGPIEASSGLDSYGWVQLLSSYRVLDSVVGRERLHVMPATSADAPLFDSLMLRGAYRPGAYVLAVSADGKSVDLQRREGGSIQAARAGDPIGAAVGFDWRPNPALLGANRKIPFWISSVRSASDGLRARMRATVADDGGNFLRVEFTGRDPAETNHTLNAILDRFVGVAGELKSYSLRERTQTLAKQLDTAEARLRTAEQALEGFRARVITLPGENTALAAGGGLSSTQPTVLSKYFEQKSQVDEIRRDREAVQRLAADPQFAPDAFLLVTAVRSAPDLSRALNELSEAETQRRQLLVKYTDAARPVQDMDARIGALRTRTIPGLATELANALQSRERELSGRISASSRELQAMPNRTITEQRLTREATSLAALYNDVQARYQANKLADASLTPDVRILDPASMPTFASSNQAARVLLMCVLASVAAAIGLALVLDRLDKRVRYPKQVTTELGLGILGVIPPLEKSGKNTEESQAQALEAFRSIRLNVAHAHGAAGPIAFTVTSPGPGDGKSLVSSNLALSFAEAGMSTLLIDGDIRRGALHRLFDVRRQPGLLDVLAGQARLDEALVPAGHSHLTLLPCGTRLHRGPELLGSPAMREIFASLRTRFQAIIVDSPPLGAGIDPFVLGTVTGGMVLVLRSGETDRHLAEAKLKLIDRLPVRLLGAILNDVRTEGPYKYYSYVYGYTAEELPQLGSGAHT